MYYPISHKQVLLVKTDIPLIFYIYIKQVYIIYIYIYNNKNIIDLNIVMTNV